MLSDDDNDDDGICRYLILDDGLVITTEDRSSEHSHAALSSDLSFT